MKDQLSPGTDEIQLWRKTALKWQELYKKAARELDAMRLEVTNAEINCFIKFLKTQSEFDRHTILQHVKKCTCREDFKG